jgi:two-component system, chemotaxis family, sensor kinase CheA
MSGRRGFSIRYKLALLAGVPVIGALLLSSIIVRDARRQVESAAALGSVEDLALLASKIGASVHQLQSERALLSLQFGQPQTIASISQFAATDHALNDLAHFFDKRDMKRLPARLARDLDLARATLAKLADQRTDASAANGDYMAMLTFYESANGSLIGAIAALMQLSDEGELLRVISSLVSVLQFKESASQEHAVLANVFQRNEFAPGVYKVLVTLVTEQAGDEREFRQNASDDAQVLFEQALRGDFWTKTAAMRQKALDTMDDAFGVQVQDWVNLQGQKIDALRKLEITLSGRMRAVALRKIAATRANLTTSLTLAAGVLVTSILLAWFIARGVTRSVSSLSGAAARVREDKDFSVRATKISHDELGVLTEAFNEMLGGIQARDTELEAHRHNLEALVDERTAELSARNDAMRIVMDNVEEGLATIHLDGTLAAETSAAFERWFGAPAEGATVGSHMQTVDENAGVWFRLGWDAIVDDMLPWELCLDQMPRKLCVAERYYEVSYRSVLREGKFDGALMVIADVTEARQREQRAAEQLESLNVFERIMHDRAGFLEFLHEASRLVDRTRDAEHVELAEMMRAVHTVKGNCSIFGIHSIAAIAHELESYIVDEKRMPEPAQLAQLQSAWDALCARIHGLLGEDENVLELHPDELEAVIASAERHTAHEQLAAQLRELTYEPVQRRFVRLADRAKSLALRLGKPDLVIEQDAGLVRLPVETWSPFWSAFVHVVRNAIDHGIETSSERVRAAKPSPARLRLLCKLQGPDCVIEVNDDGRGIDWEGVRAKAKQAGLAHTTRDDLVAALFADGLSTREQVSDTSGRGVGMSAVRDACFALGGQIEVLSEPGQGTTFRFRVPCASAASAAGARKVA